jgi:Protein of unknown function (DUF1622)
MWFQLALEFQLGSDIIATTVAPNFDALYIAVSKIIRTKGKIEKKEKAWQQHTQKIYGYALSKCITKVKNQYAN